MGKRLSKFCDSAGPEGKPREALPYGGVKRWAMADLAGQVANLSESKTPKVAEAFGVFDSANCD